MPLDLNLFNNMGGKKILVSGAQQKVLCVHVMSFILYFELLCVCVEMTVLT